MVGGGLDSGHVRLPVRGVPEVGLVAPAAAVDRLPQDLRMPGVLGGLATTRTARWPKVVSRRAAGHHGTCAGASSGSSASDASAAAHTVR